ncbi:MAG: hypothetical protein ACLSHL_15435 [Alistipes communis]
MKRLMYRLAVAAMLVVPVSAMAQTSSINAFSPYSMYGIGELQTPGVVAQRSMGGVGLGMRSSVMVNPLNPAAYSLTPRQGFLFDFGVEGSTFTTANRSMPTVRRPRRARATIRSISTTSPFSCRWPGGSDWDSA